MMLLLLRETVESLTECSSMYPRILSEASTACLRSKIEEGSRPVTRWAKKGPELRAMTSTIEGIAG